MQNTFKKIGLISLYSSFFMALSPSQNRLYIYIDIYYTLESDFTIYRHDSYFLYFSFSFNMIRIFLFRLELSLYFVFLVSSFLKIKIIELGHEITLASRDNSKE